MMPSDNVQPAVYSDPGRIIRYSESAHKFCEGVANHVRRLTESDRTSALTAYRVQGQEVLELNWQDSGGKHLMLTFLPVWSTPIKFNEWMNEMDNDNHFVEIPVADMTDAVLLAQCIISLVEKPADAILIAIEPR